MGLKGCSAHWAGVFFCGAVLVWLSSASFVHGATYTWDNDSADGLWSTCTNWSSNLCPGSADIAQFNGTNTSDATIDAAFAGSVLGVSITSGYTGTIRQERNLTIGSSDFVQDGGVFTQATYTFDINDGDFTLSGGIFNTGVGTSTVERNFDVSGGTYNASSTDAVTIDGGSGDNTTFTCTGTFPGLLNIAKTDENGTFTLASGCTASTPETTSTESEVAVNASAVLNFGNSSTLGGLAVSGTVNASTTLDINWRCCSATTYLGDLAVLSGGTLNYDGTLITVDRDVTIASSATFDVAGVTIRSTASGNSNSDTVFTCTGTFAGTVDIAKGSAFNNDFTLVSGCIVNTATSTTSVYNRIIVNSGAILNFGTSTNIGGLEISGTVNASTTLDIDSNCCGSGVGRLIINSGGTLNYEGTLITVESDVTIDAAANFDASGITIRADGDDTIDDTTLTCSGTFGGSLDIAKTDESGTFTLASGCTAITLSTTSTLGHVEVNASAVLWLGTDNTLGGLGISGTVNASSTLDINRDCCTETTYLGDLIINSGGTLNYEGTLITVEDDVTIDAAANFDASGITIRADGDDTIDDTTLTCSGTFGGDIGVSKPSGAEFTLVSGCTVNGGENSSSQSTITVNGTFDAAGFNLSASALIISSGGTLRLQGDEGSLTIPSLSAGSTIEYDGSGTYLSLKGATSTFTNIIFSGSGTWSTSTNLTIKENFEQTAGTLTLTGTTTFSGASATYYATTTGNTGFGSIVFDGSGSTFALAGSGLDLSGNLTITNGTLNTSTGSCSNAACPISLEGNWANNGTFTVNTATTTFDGTTQTIHNSNTFYHLVKETGSSDTLTFDASERQTVLGNLVLKGASSNLLALRSTVGDTQWEIDPQGTRDIEYLDVKDSNNVNATAISVAGLNITDSGNNTNWSFNAAPDTPTSLGPSGLVDGSWTTDATPTLTFTLADDDGDTVRYHVQIDDSSDFSSPVVDYLSAFAAVGSRSFTVGQAAGSGSYIVGSSGQTLSDSSWYWRVRSSDGTATSSFATANGGSIAFKTDSTDPTAGSVALSATSSSSFVATISGASDAGSGLSATPYTFSEDTSGDSTSATSSTSWTLTGLSPNTLHSFTVSVADVAGNATTTATTTGYTFANAPSSAAAVADSSSQITFTWGANGNPGTTEYFAENTTAGTDSGWTTATSWISSGLSAGTAYSFTVKARNADGIETASANASATTNNQQQQGGGGIVGVSAGNPIGLIVGTEAARSLIVGPESVTAGSVVEVVVVAYTFLTTPRTEGGDVVSITVSGTNAAFPFVTDNGDGTYSGKYFAEFQGEDIVSATVNGAPVGRDTDTVSDGKLHIGVVEPAIQKTPPGQTKKTPPAQSKKDVPSPGQVKKQEPTPFVPAPELEPEMEPFTLTYGLTRSCYRAFAWNDNDGAVVYRKIGNGHDAIVATVAPSAPWYIDVDPLAGSSLTYRFVFDSYPEETVTFTSEELAGCLVGGDTPEDQGEINEELVVEEDVDNDGNLEQFIEGVFQDTDGSSVPIAVAGEGLLIDTNNDGEPDTYWRPQAGTSPVIVAGDRLFITDGRLTATTMFQRQHINPYVVALFELGGGRVALAAEATSLAAYKDPVQLPPPPLPVQIQYVVVTTGVMSGLLASFFALFKTPLSANTLGSGVAHAWSWVAGLFVFRKRSRPWGTVYDALTKEPLDPAYVELFNSRNEKVATAITDLDGRYGFLVPAGTYTMRVRKSNYAFPSEILSEKAEDILYADLYHGGSFVLSSGAVTLNIPMDPKGVDWNQIAKRKRKDAQFVRRTDRFIVAAFNVLFFGGFVLSAWQTLAHPTPLAFTALAIYAFLFITRLFKGRPPLWGSVSEKNGDPLSFGVVRFFTESGHEVTRRIIDEQGRYFALVAPGTYRMVVEKRVGQETFEHVYEDVVHAPKGVVNHHFSV